MCLYSEYIYAVDLFIQITEHWLNVNGPIYVVLCAQINPLAAVCAKLIWVNFQTCPVDAVRVDVANILHLKGLLYFYFRTLLCERWCAVRLLLYLFVNVAVLWLMKERERVESCVYLRVIISFCPCVFIQKNQMIQYSFPLLVLAFFVHSLFFGMPHCWHSLNFLWPSPTLFSFFCSQLM